jgi:hypothetical protein
VASCCFVELVPGQHGYFKIAQSGYSFFLKISSSRTHKKFQVSLAGTHPKKQVENFATLLKREEKQTHTNDMDASKFKTSNLQTQSLWKGLEP